MKPLLRAGAATAGTFVVLGGITLATSSVVMGIVRTAVKQRKVLLTPFLTGTAGCLNCCRHSLTSMGLNHCRKVSAWNACRVQAAVLSDAPSAKVMTALVLDLLLMRHSANPDWPGCKPADEGSTESKCGAALNASNCPTSLHWAASAADNENASHCVAKREGYALGCQLETAHSHPGNS